MTRPSRKGAAPASRPSVDLQKLVQDMAGRVTRSETAIREAITALRSGKPQHALQVLETLERIREREVEDR